jgi:XTP/dITP diphosphohydrolase
LHRKPLVLASNNQAKLKELKQLLDPMGFSLVTQKEMGVKECDEPFHTFLENALHKARHASAITKLPSLADDSGICVNALMGAPGVYSARYATLGEGKLSAASPGTPREVGDAANNQKLLENLLGHADRSAFYYCVLVLVQHADDPTPVVADGLWHGLVADQPKGEFGFGYDPYFYLPELGCSAAQLSSEKKNSLSHRAIAMQSLLDKLDRKR